MLAPHQIAEALEGPIEQISEFIQHAIEDLPPEISTDICERGIYLSGGGSKLAKLDQELERRIGVKVHLPEKPEHCVITGSAALLGTLKEREHLLIKP
jgi:rod shape-determining protein MreB